MKKEEEEEKVRKGKRNEQIGDSCAIFVWFLRSDHATKLRGLEESVIWDFALSFFLQC